jgi:hypothetical protein
VVERGGWCRVDELGRPGEVRTDGADPLSVPRPACVDVIEDVEGQDIIVCVDHMGRVFDDVELHTVPSIV